MKLFLCRGGCVFLFLMSTAAIASSDSLPSFVPYVGLDAQYRYMSFDKDMGAKLISNKYPQGGIFVGARLYEYFGFELGYRKSATKSSWFPLLENGANLLTILLDPLDLISVKFEGSVREFYWDMAGYFPISEYYRLSLMAVVGMNRLQYKMKMRVLQHDLANPAIIDHDQVMLFEEKRWVPKLALGLQHMVTLDFGIRTMLSWEQTAKFKNMSPTNLHTGLVRPQYRSSIKNSIIPSIGIFYNF